VLAFCTVVRILRGMTEHRGSRLNKKPPSKKPRRRKVTKVSFASVLAEARQRKGLTRAALARLYKAAPTVISRIESGRCKIGEATILRYAKALGLRVQLRLMRW
jgi:ribosome-binding protein aMBF1 (putative translation factor)